MVFRDFPLEFHDKAQLAAEAANCAGAQDKFWEYHDKLFENQKALDKDNLIKYASDLQLDSDAFTTCLDSGRYTADVKQDVADGRKVGVTGTPAFFINGRFLNGAVPYEQFATIIDEELASLGVN
ncbi:MAG: DsbA family protein [Acidobacteria bacterium]|nr:MAG: DsbA family protein [Acidobacteriota bacterium]